LGFAYQRARRMDEALEQYEVVLEDAPDDTAALYNKGIVLQSTGRDDEAEEIWWQVLEIEPQHILAAKALGEMYAERREYRSLLEAVRPVVKENESSADLQYLTGLAYENLGRHDWASARYELALKYYPDMKEAREGLERIGREQ
ncbi:MAG: tetratricopeptide repeat protein, partial [Coriobacteriia bacterium]